MGSPTLSAHGVPIGTYVVKFGYFSVANLPHVNLIIRPDERTHKGRETFLPPNNAKNISIHLWLHLFLVTTSAMNLLRVTVKTIASKFN